MNDVRAQLAPEKAILAAMKLQFKEVLLFAAPLLMLGAIGGGLAWSRHCPDRCYSSVGQFNSDAVGAKAALAQLSQQIKRCPQASRYITRYQIMFKGTEVDDVHIVFEPSTGILSYAPDSSQGLQLWHKVDAQAIQVVAFGTGKLSALKQSGCYRTR